MLQIIQKFSKIGYSLILLGFMLFGVQNTSAQAHHGCINSVANWSVINVQKKKTPDYWIDEKFTAAEREFIKNALETAVDRIQEKDIWQEVSKTYGFAHPLADTISSSGFCNSIDIQRNLLFHQLSYLSKTTRKDSQEKFPKIYIYYDNIEPKEGELGWVGYAYYNKVKISWNEEKSDWEREGDFELYLNKFFLKQDGIYKNPDYWAGTIAHEMLHNLGHQHPDALDDTYNKFQINVLANVIRNFGFEATAGDTVYPKHICNMKSTGESTQRGGSE